MLTCDVHSYCTVVMTVKFGFRVTVGDIDLCRDKHCSLLAVVSILALIYVLATARCSYCYALISAET